MLPLCLISIIHEQAHPITHGPINVANTNAWSLYDVMIITASLCSLWIQREQTGWGGGTEPSRAKVIIMTECMKAIYTIACMKQGEITLRAFANTLPRAQNYKNDPIYVAYRAASFRTCSYKDKNTVQPPPYFLWYCLLQYDKIGLFWSKLESLELKLSIFF